MRTTIKSIADDAKAMLDVAARSQYTDAQLAGYVVDGIRRLHSVRPSERYVDGVIADPEFPSNPAALPAFEFEIGESRFFLGLAYFAAGRAHEVGITDAVNLQMAATLKKQADEIFMA